MTNPTNIVVGQKIGHLTILSQAKRKGRTKRYNWFCLCDCGRECELGELTLLNKRSTKTCRRIECNAIEGMDKITVCKNGHDLTLWNRTPTGACRGCVKEKRLMSNYGITYKEFLDIFDCQEGKCAICKRNLSISYDGKPGHTQGTRIEVDHDHRLKGKESVRGLLCGGKWSGCNRKLGKIDDKVFLANALEYIVNPPAKRVFNAKN